MNYYEALKFITEKQSLGIKPGLSRVKNLLDEMGNPQENYKIIHIAGTNGKGAVAGIIAETLSKQGKKTGLFSSPWVIDYREQIQINGEFIPEEKLARYVTMYKDSDCTEFELLTAIMYKYFADERVDYAVVECGMGGLGDATNVESQNLSVITAVSLDHTNFLGDTVEKIAMEKAGIIKENSTCVLYPNPDVRHIFENECIKKDTRLVDVESGDETDVYTLDLMTATEALYQLGFNTGASFVNLPARQEIINGVLTDGGHNESAGKALADCHLVGDSEVALMGMMKDKNAEAYLTHIAPKCKMIITTTPNNPRAMSSDGLMSIAKKYCNEVVSIPDPVKAIAFAKEKGLTLICGSFYLIREIRDYI